MLELFHAIILFFLQALVSQQVEIVGKPQPATPTQPATPGTEHELQHYRKAMCIQCSLQVENLF